MRNCGRIGMQVLVAAEGDVGLGCQECQGECAAMGRSAWGLETVPTAIAGRPLLCCKASTGTEP